MGRKPKLSAEIKAEICERYLNGESSSALADIWNIHERTIQRWANIYRSQGASCFNAKPHNAKYTKEFKQQVVGAYLAGEGSIDNFFVNIKFLHMGPLEPESRSIITLKNLRIMILSRRFI